MFSDRPIEVFNDFKEILAGNSTAAEYHESPIVTHNGKEALIAWHNNYLRDENDLIIGTLSAGEDITKRRCAEEKTQELLEQNRQITQRMFQLQEKERRHLARELHDEFSQQLAAIHLNAETIKLQSKNDHPKTYECAQVIDQITTDVNQNIRSMLRQLRPSLLDELGLKETLVELINQWQIRFPAIVIKLSLEGELNDFEDNFNISIYRIIQESLTNVAKHANASQVFVQLNRQPGKTKSKDTLLLTVKDDGQGIDTALDSEGIGLPGLRERVLAIGGDFVMNTAKGKGVYIKARFPIKFAARKDF